MPGNERADREALQATVLTTIPLINIHSCSDVRNVIDSHVIDEWQVYWRNLNAKLNAVKNNIIPQAKPRGLARKGETTIDRLRMCHIHMTHSFLMIKEESPSHVESP